MFGRKFDSLRGPDGKVYTEPFFGTNQFNSAFKDRKGDSWLLGWAKAHQEVPVEWPNDNRKFKVAPDPLVREASEKHIKGHSKVTSDWIKQEITKEERDNAKLLNDGAAGKSQRQALATAIALEHQRHKGYRKQLEQGANQQFSRNFANWLIGQGTESEYKKAFPGVDAKQWRQQRRLVSRDPSVLKYVKDWQNRVIAYQEKLAAMRLRMGRGNMGQMNLNDAYLYYKYIVCGLEFDPQDFGPTDNTELPGPSDRYTEKVHSDNVANQDDLDFDKRERERADEYFRAKAERGWQGEIRKKGDGTMQGARNIPAEDAQHLALLQDEERVDTSANATDTQPSADAGPSVDMELEEETPALLTNKQLKAAAKPIATPGFRELKPAGKPVAKSGPYITYKGSVVGEESESVSQSESEQSDVEKPVVKHKTVHPRGDPEVEASDYKRLLTYGDDLLPEEREFIRKYEALHGLSKPAASETDPVTAEAMAFIRGLSKPAPKPAPKKLTKKQEDVRIAQKNYATPAELDEYVALMGIKSSSLTAEQKERIKQLETIFNERRVGKAKASAEPKPDQPPPPPPSAPAVPSAEAKKLEEMTKQHEAEIADVNQRAKEALSVAAREIMNANESHSKQLAEAGAANEALTKQLKELQEQVAALHAEKQQQHAGISQYVAQTEAEKKQLEQKMKSREQEIQSATEAYKETVEKQVNEHLKKVREQVASLEQQKHQAEEAAVHLRSQFEQMHLSKQEVEHREAQMAAVMTAQLEDIAQQKQALEQRGTALEQHLVQTRQQLAQTTEALGMEQHTRASREQQLVETAAALNLEKHHRMTAEEKAQREREMLHGQLEYFHKAYSQEYAALHQRAQQLAAQAIQSQHEKNLSEQQRALQSQQMFAIAEELRVAREAREAQVSPEQMEVGPEGAGLTQGQSASKVSKSTVSSGTKSFIESLRSLPEGAEPPPLSEDMRFNLYELVHGSQKAHMKEDDRKRITFWYGDEIEEANEAGFRGYHPLAKAAVQGMRHFHHLFGKEGVVAKGYTPASFDALQIMYKGNMPGLTNEKVAQIKDDPQLKLLFGLWQQAWKESRDTQYPAATRKGAKKSERAFANDWVKHAMTLASK